MPNLLSTVTFLFAGDGSLASDGLSVFLQTKSNFLMVSECGTGAQAIADIRTHSPEIAVIDAQLPDMTAGQIIQAVREANRDLRIIVLGASAEREVADQLLAAGADAYIVRSGPSRHLNEAIRYVRDGGKYLAPELTRDAPVQAEKRAAATDHGEVIASLHEALEAQGRTVQRLERAMDRAQYAIELLQQKVEQLTGAPIEVPAPSEFADESSRHHMLTLVRSKMGAVAAAVMVGIMGFMLAGVLRPPPTNNLADIASLGTEDSLRAESTPGLNLSGWEMDTVLNASALMRNKQYAAAEKLCRNLLKQDPANLSASRVLASALYHQDRIEESAEVVRSMAVPLGRNTQLQRPTISFMR